MYEFNEFRCTARTFGSPSMNKDIESVDDSDLYSRPLLLRRSSSSWSAGLNYAKDSKLLALLFISVASGVGLMKIENYVFELYVIYIH